MTGGGAHRVMTSSQTRLLLAATTLALASATLVASVATHSLVERRLNHSEGVGRQATRYFLVGAANYGSSNTTAVHVFRLTSENGAEVLKDPV